MVIRGKNDIKRRLRRLRHGARFRYYADLIVALQSELDCEIELIPCEKALFEEDEGAVLITRLLRVHSLPGGVSARKGTRYIFQHALFYDVTLPDVVAARLILHELFHIFDQVPQDPCWHAVTDTKTGIIDYGKTIEKRADKFSLRGLREHPFKAGLSVPGSPGRLIAMLNGAVSDEDTCSHAWPHHMDRKEAIRYIHQLYQELVD